jgi:hypothetical protein
VSLVIASILVLAIPVVMMAVSPHHDRGTTNVRIQFAAGNQNAPPAQPAQKAPAKSGGGANPAAGRQGSAGGGAAPGRSGGGAANNQGSSGGASTTNQGSNQGSNAGATGVSDTQLTHPARSPVQGGGDSGMIGVPGVTGSLPSLSSIPKLPNIHFHLPQPNRLVLSKWVARCDVSKPGAPGTMAFDVYWQHHPSSSSQAFPVDQMNYPCGSDWAIIPGADPFVPPVWVGKFAPFTPATNYPGGQIFTAVDAPASEVAADLQAAGVPVAASGQLLTYGSDGVPVYTSDWWGLTFGVKDAAGKAIAKDGGYPHMMWRTDAHHWGWGNVGIGLPAKLKLK